MTTENLNEKVESKSSLLSRVIKISGAMTKAGLNDLLSKTLEVSPDPDADGTSSVESSFDTSVSAVNAAVAEDVRDIFADSELSEEFKTKASVLFEAAVNNRLNLEVTRITEELETKFQTSITEAIDEINNSVETYIDYIAEEWYKENAAVVENAYKTTLSDSLLVGIKKLFVEQNVEIPEDNTPNVVEELQFTIDALGEELNAVKNKNIEFQKSEQVRAEADRFTTVSEGLVDTEVEKFKVLTESIEYSSLDEYEEKLKIIRQQYFAKGDAPKAPSVGLINEDVIGDDRQQVETVVTGQMKHYATAISKSVQK